MGRRPMPETIRAWRLRWRPQEIPELASLPAHWQRATRLTQALMAMLLGCSERQYRRLEQGTGPVSRAIVAGTARLLALTEAETVALYAWAGHPAPAPVASLGGPLVQMVADRPDVGVLLLDPGLTIRRVHADPQRFGGLRIPVGVRITDLLSGEDRLADRLRAVLDTGGPALSLALRLSAGPHPALPVSVSVLRLQEIEGLRLPGLMVTLINVSTTSRARDRRARRYLDIVRDTPNSIGSSLDPTTTAEQLAAALLPLAGVGGRTVVYLAAEILQGEQPPRRSAGGVIELVCAARCPGDAPWPPDFISPGESVHQLPETVSVRLHQHGELNMLPDRAVIYAGLDDDPNRIRHLVPDIGTGPIGFVSIPIVTAEAAIAGAAQMWKFGGQFSGDDIQLARDIVGRAAIAVGLAREHTRALLTIEGLRRRLADQPAAGGTELRPRALPRPARAWDVPPEHPPRAAQPHVDCAAPNSTPTQGPVLAGRGRLPVPSAMRETPTHDRHR
jgi:hypothetical protein